MTGFKMASGGTNYSVKDGIIVNAAEDAIVLAPQGFVGEYRIPAGIYTVGEYAFYNCTKLTKVTIPEWVTEIKAYAFYYCTGMTELIFEGTKNSDDLAVRQNAFNYCRYVSVLNVPANLVIAEVYSFGIGYSSAYATVNVNIDRESVDIAENAFVQRSSTGYTYFYVKVVNIGATAPEINVSSVFGSALSEVNVDPKNIHYSSVDGILFDKAIETLMYYPATRVGAYVIPDTVKKIDNNAFYNRTMLTAITIPASVEEIGYRAFYNCTGMRTVTFVTGGTAPLTIGQDAFRVCNIANLTIPARTVVIGDSAFASNGLRTLTFEAGGTADLTIQYRAFYSCSYLETVTLPERTKVIENNAFESCLRMKTISIPASVEKMGGYTTVDDIEVLSSTFSVFTTCYALEQVNVEEGNKYFKSIGSLLYYKGLYEGWYGSSSVFHDHTDGNVKALVFVPISAKGVLEVPATVGYVFASAFAYNGNYTSLAYTANDGGITKVTFAASNNCIGNKIYFGAKAFSYAVKMTEIVLPTGLTDISANMFEYCTRLTTITIPNTVEKIQANAFYYCSRLENVNFEEGGTADLTLVGGKSATKSIFYYCFKMKSITLPERTVSVGNYAMAYCAFEEIHLPSTLKTIGKYAFASQYIAMSALRTVTFAEGSVLESIGDYAFYKNGILEAMDLPTTVKTIGANAFSYCLSLKSLTLPSALKSIGNNAFLNCVSIESITLSEGIVTISSNMFYGWNALKSVVIPSSVTSIGVSAFEDCTSLASVTFASGSQLNSIGDYAFKNTALTTFAFPEVVDGESNVVYITLGQRLFDGCTTLKSVHLSKSVSSIDNVFVGCSAIGTITVAEGNTFFVFSSDGSMLTSPTGDGIRYIFDASIDANGVMTIPEGVTHISAGAFGSHQNLKKVVLPESLREIGDYAFYGCTNLKEVVFSNGLASLEIGQYVFAQTGLDSIVIPTGVVGIGDYAFSGSAIKNIEFKGALANVGKYMFNDCKSLTNVVFPDVFALISEGMFYGCTALQNLTIPGGITSISAYAFYGSGFKTINLPQAGLTSIGNYAFAASALESITLGGNITTLGNYVFQNCASLKSATLGNNITTIGTYLFDGCTALTSVTLPSNSTYVTLSAYMFNGCTALPGITIPETVTTIGANAFNGAGITKVVVPVTVSKVAGSAFKGSSIKEIEFLGETCTFQASYTFQNCSQLEKITLPSKMTATVVGMFSGCSSIETIELPDTIKTLAVMTFEKCAKLQSLHLPDDLTNMNAVSAFSGCISLKKLVIPGKVSAVGINQFNGCTGLEEVIFEENTSLKALTINMFYGCTSLKYIDLRPVKNLNNLGATSPTTMGVVTFYNCYSLEEAWLPAGVTLIPHGAFFGCYSLKAIHTEGVITQIGPTAFSGCSSLEGFPEDGATLVNIQDSGFANCTSLKRVVLSSKLTTLSSSAYAGCTGLEEVVVEEGIGNLTAKTIFKNCTNLKKVTLPKLMTSIPSNMFEGCTSLTDINIPEGLVSIGSMAFAYTNLGRVEIPASLETIGAGAFAGCANVQLVMPANSSFTVGANGEIYDGAMELIMVPANLAGEFTIPEGRSVGSYAFAGCSKLTKINLPDSMTEIPQYMFAGLACSPEIVGKNLTAIGNYAFYKAECVNYVIPSWVETIGEYAFEYSLIEKLTIPSNVKSIGRYAFAYCDNLVEVTIEDGLESIGGTTSTTGYVFAYDKALAKVTLPKTLKTIGYSGFYYCSELRHIDFPESLRSVYDRAFQYSGLESVYFPKNVVYLGPTSFGSLANLTSVEFAEGIEAIGYENQKVLGGYSGNVFYSCKALVDVKLPKSLLYIGEQMFKECSALEKLELPDGLVSIGSNAFQLCTGIKQIVIPRSVRIMGTTVFASWTADQTVCFEHTVSQAMFFSDVVVNVTATVVYGYVKPIQ
ncbi:MAG: leucine-rich repeat domain-containing protein [Eubacteriales bacterium]|nr:leucine-rich repeat domain-containing protein [Eubacteriales bacterium]